MIRPLARRLRPLGAAVTPFASHQSRSAAARQPAPSAAARECAASAATGGRRTDRPARWMAAAMVSVVTAAATGAQQVQFEPMATREPQGYLPIGNEATLGGYAVGDLDGDGRRDFVVCDSTSSRLVFTTAVGQVTLALLPISIGMRPQLVDLDGDGDADLLMGPRAGTPTRVMLVRNDPPGPSQVVLPALVSTVTCQGQVLGDVDGDGDLDLVLALGAGQGLPALVLLRNDGAMQFSFQGSAMPFGLPFGLWPSLVDVDGDGDLDLLASTAAAGMVLLHNQGGVFVDARASLPAFRIGHRFLCIGDFDGDGFPDAAASWWNGDLDLLWGSGGGSFTFQPAVLAAIGARSLQSIDFDGDGDLDLIAEHAGGVDLLRNGGGRTFVRELVIEEPVAAVEAADVDGDGMVDLLFATVAASRITRCRFGGAVNPEDAAFALGLKVPLGAHRRQVPLAGDIDGNGRTDLLLPSTAGLIVEHALGDGRYRTTVSPVPVATSLPFEQPLLGDLDGDGALDLVLSSSAFVRTYHNDGAGGFSAGLDLASASSGFDATRLVDVDGDGDLDIVRAANAGVILLRNVQGIFQAPLVLATSSLPPACLEAIDLDGDGDVDLVTAIPLPAPQTGHLVLANDGAGNFAPMAGAAVDLGTNAMSVRAADLDGDGDPDLFAAGSTLRLLIHQGGGRFLDRSATALPAITTAFSSNIVLGDLDGDGDVDLFATLRPGGPAQIVLANDGQGRFLNVSASRLPLNAVPLSTQWVVTAADVDDDGDLDLLVGQGPAAVEQVLLTNNLRQLRCPRAPRVGGNLQIDVLSGPSFGSPGLAFVAVALAGAAQPSTLVGFAGQVQLDLPSLQILGVVPTSSSGASTALVPVPALAALIGVEIWLQAAVVASVESPGLTNALYDVLLR